MKMRILQEVFIAQLLQQIKRRGYGKRQKIHDKEVPPYKLGPVFNKNPYKQNILQEKMGAGEETEPGTDSLSNGRSLHSF